MAGSTVVVSVLAETSKFKKGMEELGNSAKLVSGAMGLVATAVAAIGFSSLIGEAAAASDATDKFKQTLNFAGIKPDVIESLTKSTRAYADQTVYSLSDVQSITAQLGANGVKDYGIMAEALGNLNAVAGGTAETYKRVGSVLTQTNAAGKLTTENWNQLSEAIPGASGILQAALLKNGAYTGNFRDAMAKGQITAEEFNTALKQTGMSDAAKEAATSTKTFEGAWGGLKAAMVGGLGDVLTKLKPSITAAMNGMSSAITAAMPSILKLMDVIGTKFKAAFDALAPVVKAVSDNFGGLSGVMDKLSPVLTLISGPFGIITKALIAMAPALEAAAKSGKGFGEALAPLGPALGAGLSSAITGLVDIIVKAIPVLLPVMIQGFVSLLTAITNAIPVVLPTIITGITQLVTAIANVLPTIIPVLITAAVTLFTALVNALPIIMPSIIAGIIQLVTAITAMLPTLIPVLITAAVTLFTALVNALPIILPELINGAITLINLVVDMLPTLIPLLIDAAVKLFTALVNALPIIIPALINGAVKLIDTILRLLPTLIPKLLAAAVTLFTAICNAVPKITTSLLETIGTLITKGIDAIKEGGKKIMDGFLDGLKESWKKVTDFVGGIADWIKQNKGPLPYDYKLLQPAGKAIMGGFGDSLASGFEDVKGMVNGFAPALSGAFNGVGGDLAMAAASGSGNTFYSFDGLSFSSANAQEASVLDEFAQFLRRKARAA